MLIFLIVVISIIFVFGLLYIWQFWRTNFYKRHKNWLVCTIIVAVYAAFAFTNLGNLSSPQTRFFGEQNTSVEIDFGAIAPVEYIQFMTGASYGQIFMLEFSYDGENWSDGFFMETGRAFAWDIRSLIVQTRFVRLTPTTDQFFIMEMAFRTAVDTFIPVVYVSENGAALFDEWHLIPLQALDYMHSTYFDEIYYPKTAYQLIHGMEIYEWTHPPLGKVILAWGIEIFGMTPFGWRFMGTLAGVLMLIPFYLLALAIFDDINKYVQNAQKSRSSDSVFWAGFATLVFAFDFMHYVQTRVGAIDSFVILFIVAMFYFMYKYGRLDFANLPLLKTFVPLLFCGIFMGFAIATKWFGFYGAAGIAVIFFVITGRNFVLRKQIPNFYKRTALTFAACVGFFIVIPVSIYAISYIPYGGVSSLYYGGFWEIFYLNQLDMLNFHLVTMLDAEHTFASPWWEWLVNWRPMLYYDLTLPVSNLRQGISAFGNPIVWWGGLPALLYTVYKIFAKSTKNAFIPLFLVIGYMAFLVPWLIAGRVTFIYYYFPNVIFLSLMIAYAIKENILLEKLGNLKKPAKSAKFVKNHISNRTIACIFAIITMALFLLFYPVITGIPVTLEFVVTFLRWGFMREWLLVV
ncbi:MAG: phospholipid carrier-dependent glycosyltransferase [Defluviitaleaceae bacterium]|nr:phospholipid carrier-dependent glycosyltransferase [Defluviitaleaceae bacterium]